MITHFSVVHRALQLGFLPLRKEVQQLGGYLLCIIINKAYNHHH